VTEVETSPQCTRLPVSRTLRAAYLALSGRVVDRGRPVVHADGEQGRVPLGKVQAGHAAVGMDRPLRVLGVAHLE